MNRQKAFDKVYAHAQRKEKSIWGNNYKCAYRGPNGAKCFIGCLIPDETCPPNIDDGNVGLTSVLGLMGVEPEDYRFYQLLQEIHDENIPEEWNNVLRKFAEDWGLTVA